MTMTMNDNVEQPVLTVSELCIRWRCRRRSVMDRIHSGELRAFKVGKRVYRVAIAEIERFERTRDAA